MQAAFRDHIRSGERIMFLASMGRLKHKRTRNTIAAEPTPRSSCASEADHKTAPPPGDACCPEPQAAIQTSSEVRALVGGHNSDTTSARRSSNEKGCDTSPSESDPRFPTSTAFTLGKRSDHDSRGKLTGGKRVPADQSLPAGRLEKEARAPSAAVPRCPPRRASERQTNSPSHRQLDRRRRPRSVGPGGRHRPPSSGADIARGSQSDAPSPSNNSRLAVLAAKPVGSVPLHIGPEISRAVPAEGPGSPGAGPGASFSSTVARVRSRPATAGSHRQEGTGWRSARPGPPHWVAGRNVGGDGGDSDGGGRGDGGCGERSRAVCQTEGKITHPASNARVASGGGGDQLSSDEAGSFAASVVRSARPLADYDSYDAEHGQRRLAAPRCGMKGRPKSANAAVRGVAHAVAASDAQYPAAHTLAAETRLMPVKTIGKAFHGHRLAGVQAWDPHSAAAVRAARAERFLRRARIEWTTGGPMAAPEKARRAAAASIRGYNSDKPTFRHGGREDQHRGVSAPTGRGKGEGDGGPDDWCGMRGLMKDCRT